MFRSDPLDTWLYVLRNIEDYDTRALSVEVRRALDELAEVLAGTPAGGKPDYGSHRYWPGYKSRSMPPVRRLDP